MLIGLADGLDPCAFYVLVAMLGVLLHVRSRKRLLPFGGMFVVASGVVYFLFMTACLGIFTLSGLNDADEARRRVAARVEPRAPPAPVVPSLVPEQQAAPEGIQPAPALEQPAEVPR